MKIKIKSIGSKQPKRINIKIKSVGSIKPTIVNVQGTARQGNKFCGGKNGI